MPKFITTKPEFKHLTQEKLFEPTTQTAEQRHTRIKFNATKGCWEIHDDTCNVLSTDHMSRAGAVAWEQQHFTDLLNKEEQS